MEKQKVSLINSSKLNFTPLVHKVKDPVRYPAVINHYEDLAKSFFRDNLNAVVVEIVKTMVDLKK